jgi:hypothetical protein
MEQIKLEVGKTYRVRDESFCGAIREATRIKIVAYDEWNKEKPFRGEDGCHFWPNGVLSASGEETVFDLVREVQPQNK